MTWLPLDAVGAVAAHRADEEWVSPHHYRHGSPCQSCGQQWIAGQKGRNRGSSDWASGESVGWYRSRRWCRIGSMYCFPVFMMCVNMNYWIMLHCVRLSHDDQLPVAWSCCYEGRELEGNPEIFWFLKPPWDEHAQHLKSLLEIPQGFKTFKIFHDFWAFKLRISLVQPVSAYLRSNPGVVAAAEPGAICFSAC